MRRFFAALSLIILVAAPHLSCPAPPDPDPDPDPCPKGGGDTCPDEEIVRYTYEVSDIFPHDTEAFTQGLVIDDGILYEGTGLRGHSSLRRVDLETGAIEQIVSLADDLFGEGIAVFGDEILQLTWQDHVGFIYDRDTFEELGQFTYDHQGWGITHDGVNLIISDGSSLIRFKDPDTMEVVRTVTVTEDGLPVIRLNELEYIDGEIWANVWLTDEIVIIDPATGDVTGTVDCSGLLTPAEAAAADVLNGIAYNHETGQLYVTGKEWPWLFEIALVPIEE